MINRLIFGARRHHADHLIFMGWGKSCILVLLISGRQGIDFRGEIKQILIKETGGDMS